MPRFHRCPSLPSGKRDKHPVCFLRPQEQRHLPTLWGIRRFCYKWVTTDGNTDQCYYNNILCNQYHLIRKYGYDFVCFTGSCTVEGVLPPYRKACDNRPFCFAYARAEKDPCPTISKYLEIVYSCEQKGNIFFSHFYENDHSILTYRNKILISLQSWLSVVHLNLGVALQTPS